VTEITQRTARRHRIGLDAARVEKWVAPVRSEQHSQSALGHAISREMSNQFLQAAVEGAIEAGGILLSEFGRPPKVSVEFCIALARGCAATGVQHWTLHP
jgi:hypothetical protein